MPLPTLTPEQRSAALAKAAEVRKARAELKEQLKAGKTTLPAVLDRAETDDVVGKLKVSAVLQSLPGIGKIRATQIMEKLKIADSRRLRGLGATSSARLCSASSRRTDQSLHPHAPGSSRSGACVVCRSQLLGLLVLLARFDSLLARFDC